MWDVGVQYGKAIRVAKREYQKHVERFKKESAEQSDTKVTIRKPVRPHIRHAHWHKYLVGKGRKEAKYNWIAPVYVGCHGKEVPVTIREIQKGRGYDASNVGTDANANNTITNRYFSM